jgi:hypothetical protein
MTTTEISPTRPQHRAGTPTSQHPRSHRLLAPTPPRPTTTRSYFRSLRAAEMAAWEVTGGDYVLARFASAGTRATIVGAASL